MNALSHGFSRELTYDKLARPLGKGDTLILDGGELPLWVIGEISVPVDPRTPANARHLLLMTQRWITLETGAPIPGIVRVMTHADAEEIRAAQLGGGAS